MDVNNLTFYMIFQIKPDIFYWIYVVWLCGPNKWLDNVSLFPAFCLSRAMNGIVVVYEKPRRIYKIFHYFGPQIFMLNTYALLWVHITINECQHSSSMVSNRPQNH